MELGKPDNATASSGLLSLFRAQSQEARVTLLLSWGLLVAMVVVLWIRYIQTADPNTVGLWIPVVFSLATPAFIWSQLAACRGGDPYRAAWIPPVLILLALVPMFWGVLSLVLMYALATTFLTYPRKIAVAVCLGSGAVFLLLFSRIGPTESLGAGLALAELGVYSLILITVTRLAVQLDDLHLTREVHARRQVDLERERIGRDLHDLIGRTLVAASLRNQTALRTLGGRDPQVAQRLEKLHETLSRGQVQLRSLTNGPSIAHLEGELDNARMLCERVNINLRIEVDGPPPSNLEALCGLVVRENITNVLKHSRASWCTITITSDQRDTTIRVENDGVLATHNSLDSTADSRLGRAVQAAGGTAERRSTTPGAVESVARLPIPTEVRS